MMKKQEVVPLPLTDVENRIFEFLRRVSQFVGDGGLDLQGGKDGGRGGAARGGKGGGKRKKQGRVKLRRERPPTLRVAGGWVRDKLLGRRSTDVDVVIDSMTGAQFAHATRAYEASLAAKAKKEGTSYERLCEGAVTIVKENPEQSKHLETAKITICGLPIDFAHLRTEIYDSGGGGGAGGGGGGGGGGGSGGGGQGGGRIPTRVDFGSPEDDTLRRDFTINSLFFNINSGNFEDFTPGSSGVLDLRRGVLRTPRQCLAGIEANSVGAGADGQESAAAEAVSALQVGRLGVVWCGLVWGGVGWGGVGWGGVGWGGVV